MSTDKRLEYIEMVDRLSEALWDKEEQTPEEIREELRAQGFDIDGAQTSFLELQKKFSSESKASILDEAKKQRQKMEIKTKEIIDRIKSWTDEQILNRLKEFTENDPGLAVAYRDYKKEESNNIDELREIFADIMIAKEIQDEDENEEG